MQWMIPESKLGQEQTLILGQCLKVGTPCSWIQGFAGSGKTVLLVHAMERLRVDQPGKSVCFVTFTHALKDLVGSGLSDKTRALPIMTADRFISEGRHYNILLVDEIQDLENHKLVQLKAMCDQMIVAGDVEQSIYQTGVTADQIANVLTPTTHKLTVLYRLTQSLHSLARALLPSSSIASAKVQRQQDTDVVLAHARSPEEEAEWVIDKALTLARPGKPALIILPTRDGIFDFIEVVAQVKGAPPPERQYVGVSTGSGSTSRSRRLDWKAINEAMRAAGLPMRYLGSSFGDLLESDKKPLIYVMTYHSAKGLDFPHVFLPRMNSSVRLWRDDADLERRLFFVGVTRSRENLFITYSTGEPHRLVGELPKRYLTERECTKPGSAGKGSREEHLF